jgi:alkyl sulfatase BDS1-like metallo-beta-lactamase superfamily hydrolase
VQVALGKRLARAPAQVADGFARAVRRAPEGSLEQVLRTPVRRAVLEAIFWQMPQHFDRGAASGMDATIRWRITRPPAGGADTYELRIADGRCRARRGQGNRDPQLTITLDAAEFVKLATGNSDPMNAYFSGRVALAGDIMLGAKLQSLFRIPGRTQPRQPLSTVSESR